MIRILQVMGGMNRRGAESFIMNIYRKIDRSKVQFDFLVYTDDKQDFEDEINSLGGRVIHMPCSSGFGAIKSIGMIRDVIRKYGPYKAIHAQTLMNIAYVWLAARKFPGVVRMAHSHNTRNRVVASGVVKTYEFLAKFIIRHYSQIMFACGEDAGQYLFGKRFRRDGIILKNGIDLDVYTKLDKGAIAAIRKSLRLDGQLVIGSVARFNKVKNHSFMLRIASALKKQGVSFLMVFVGNGPDEQNVRKNVENAGLQNEIVFAGLRSDIDNIMHTFDVFLMPSHFEGNPVTLVEAQAAGLPCVITDNITDEMDMGLGLIHKLPLSERADTWASKIVEASKHRCSNEELIRSRIASCGYDAQSTANQLLEIYLR